MKLIHLSDLHLGKRVNGFSMLEDQHYILREILKIIDREAPDGVLIAGDVYDKSVPPAEAVALLDEFLVELSQRHLQVYLISGNHDSPERLAFGGRLMDQSGVHVAPVYDGRIVSFTQQDQYGSVEIFLLPFLKPAHVRRFFPDDPVDSYTDALRTVLSHAAVPADKRTVLVTHQFVTGASRCDSEDLSVGGSDNVDAAVFAPFDYVALGHLHGPQKAGERGQYSGSPLKYFVDEERQKKGYFQLEWDGREMARQFVPCAPLRDVRRVKGTFAHLLEAGEQSPVEDYVEIELTDSAPVLLAAERLRPFYPNLLSVLNPWMGESLTGERAARLKGQDEATVFAAFLREVCGTEPDPQDQALFQEVLESLGESQET